MGLTTREDPNNLIDSDPPTAKRYRSNSDRPTRSLRHTYRRLLD